MNYAYIIDLFEERMNIEILQEMATLKETYGLDCQVDELWGKN